MAESVKCFATAFTPTKHLGLLQFFVDGLFDDGSLMKTERLLGSYITE